MFLSSIYIIPQKQVKCIFWVTVQPCKNICVSGMRERAHRRQLAHMFLYGMAELLLFGDGFVL